ncbi:MAG: glycosyltransferase [Kiritimatiellaeota bacterium]|nr:glycosyltransferase [Kiritimatiellota bacterium]
MRIVHAAHYSFVRDGVEFFNCEYKLHTGLCQAGHYVFPFSVNDRARVNLFRSKRLGGNFANRCLLTCCKHVEPDLLLLGHAQAITPHTLQRLRHAHPKMKIALWYVDQVYLLRDCSHLFGKLPLLDAIFVTTGGDLLAQFRRDGCRAAFIPNPADANVERWKVDELQETDFDLVFIGSDRLRPERRALLEELAAKADSLRLGFAGCLGRPGVFGEAKDRMLKRTLLALNLSDRNDVFLYSSDRIVQLAGNGICTLTASASGLHALYEPDREMVFFDSIDDLAAKAKRLVAAPGRARAIGRAGRVKTHACYSGKAVAEFICQYTFGNPAWREFPWAPYCGSMA